MASQETKDSFHMLLLGDFSGRANRQLCQPGSELAARRPRPVDRDNLDEVMGKLDVQLTGTVVAAGEEPVTIRFHELDDFEPDQLFENVALFSSLRSLRQRLLNETTFAAAAEEILAWEGASTSKAEQPEEIDVPPQSQPVDASDAEQNVGALLDRMIADVQAADQRHTDSAGMDWNRLIHEIVAPVMPHRVDPRQDELVACVDSATRTLMTALLHHPHFQQLEAAWRGLDFLVRRVETDVKLKIFLVDVSKSELVADLLNNQELSNTGLYRLLVEQTRQTPGAVPWSLLCGLYSFGESADDVALLGQLARIARAAQAPFLSAADASLVGCHDAGSLREPDQWKEMNAEVKSHWEDLCRSEEASQLSLLWPRFLLRLPYGAATRPIDAFPLEEMPQGIRHQRLLWGNPTILAACAIGQSFAQLGWNLQMSKPQELANLPVFTVKENGDSVLQPCAELLLTDRVAERLRERGITPVLSIQGRDAIRLSSLQSISGTPMDDN